MTTRFFATSSVPEDIGMQHSHKWMGASFEIGRNCEWNGFIVDFFLHQLRHKGGVVTAFSQERYLCTGSKLNGTRYVLSASMATTHFVSQLDSWTKRNSSFQPILSCFNRQLCQSQSSVGSKLEPLWSKWIGKSDQKFETCHWSRWKEV